MPSVKKSQITPQHVENALKFTDEIVENYPDRLIGTNSCNKTGNRIAQEFEKNCDSGSVKIEKFTCHPKSFIKHFRFDIILYIIGTLLTLLNLSVWAIIPFGLATTLFLSQSIFYFEIFDIFFPKAQGQNIYGSVEPEGEVKQQIIFCGHHDAAYVFNFMDKSPKLYPYLAIGSMVPIILAPILTIIAIFTGTTPIWIKIVFIVCLVGVIPSWWFTGDKVAPGAGDDMIATAMNNETIKIFSDQKKAGNNLLKNTRLVCLSVDGEECGIRGSRAFAKLHENDLKKLKTYAFCIDTVYNADKLLVFQRDLNLTVPLSKKMSQELVNLAKELGYGAELSQIPFGGGSTDAASFARIGVEATCLLAFDIDIFNLEEDLVYHTQQDVTKAIEPEVVEQSLNLAVEYILKKDKEIS